MPPYVEVPDSVLGVDKPVRSFDHKQQRDNIKFHHHGQSGVDGVFAGVITPTQLTANQNDWNPTGLATASTVRVSSDKVVTITGMQQGLEGQAKVIMNVGSFTINFAVENTGSSAANRFANGFSLLAGRMVVFVYDSVASRWRTESSGAKSGDIPVSFLKMSANNLGQAATSFMKYLSSNADGTEANTEHYVVWPFTMKELRACAAGSIPASNSAVITVRKNGADTSLTCTIGAGQTQASNTANSVDFGFGDRFSLKIVTSATAGTNDYAALVRMFEPNTDFGHPELFLRGSPSTAPGRFYAELGGNTDAGGVDLGRAMPLPQCFVGFHPSLTPVSVLFRKNAAALAFGTGVLAHVFTDATPKCFYAAGDGLATDAQATGNAGWNFRFESAFPDSYDPCPIGFSDTAITQATTRFFAGYGWAGLTTESEAQIPMPACRVRNMRALSNFTPPAGQTYTVTLRKNGVDTGLTIQFTNTSGSVVSDLVNEVTFAAGDLLSVKGVASATSGGGSVSISVEVFA